MKELFRTSLIALTTSMALFSSVQLAIAQPPDEAFIRSLIPAQNISAVEPAPMDGWFYAIVDGETLFFSDDRQYLIVSGRVIDLEKRQDVGEMLKAKINKPIIDNLNPEDLIIYEPEGEARHSVTIFTDPNCGYCRKLHQELQTYLDAGIQIRYAATDAFGGPPSRKRLIKAWCAEDQKAAMDRIKNGENLSNATCENSGADKLLALSQNELMLRATPAIFSDQSGMQIGGYLSANDMLGVLESE